SPARLRPAISGKSPLAMRSATSAAEKRPSASASGIGLLNGNVSVEYHNPTWLTLPPSRADSKKPRVLSGVNSASQNQAPAWVQLLGSWLPTDRLKPSARAWASG